MKDEGPHDGHWLYAQNKHFIGELVLGKWPTGISPLRTPDRHLTQLEFDTLLNALGNTHYFNVAQFSSRTSRVTIASAKYREKFSKYRHAFSTHTNTHTDSQFGDISVNSH